MRKEKTKNGSYDILRVQNFKSYTKREILYVKFGVWHMNNQICLKLQEYHMKNHRMYSNATSVILFLLLMKGEKIQKDRIRNPQTEGRKLKNAD